MGHKMLAYGFDIALSHGKEVAKLYVDSWNEVVSGEIDEVDFNDNGSRKFMSAKEQIFEAYYKIIDLKTAALFSSACQAGALEADMAGDILKVFSDYGREIGLAYQLADDLVDLAHGEMIDSVIIPILNRLENRPKIGTIKKREIKKLFAKNEEKIKKFYIDEIKRHVKNAEELSNSDLIPKSSYKKLMCDAPTYIINRMLREINVTI
jgi:geranylgeranyl pyrophosphate synthase